MFVSNFRRGIVRSSLVRKSQYLGASCRAFSGSSGRGDSKSDLELHRDYQGIMPRFDAARGLLFTQEGEEKFEMYVEANIGGGFISKMLVLTDLEHPLFLKYNFDAKEFMKGVKHAFESVTGGVLHGEEFRNYVERSTIMSNANEMIDVILDREEELKASGETVDKKISQNLQEDIAEVIRKQEVGDKPSGDKANADEEALEETSETVLEEVVSASAGVDDDEEDAMIEPVEFLRSVCTEEAFQDFVRITEKENTMKHKFLITNEELDSFFLSRAYIRFEEEDHAQLDDEEGKGDDVVKKTTTNVDIENLRVIADINVKFITLCNINLPRRDGGDDKKWKMMRVFKWTFSSDINKGRDGLDWKISEVSASGWN